MFDTSFNDGVTSAVITVYGARGADSSNNGLGGQGTYIVATINDIDPYPTGTKPKLYIELGVRGTAPNTAINTNSDEKTNGGYGNGGGGGGGGFTRVFYEYIPLGSSSYKTVVLIAGGGGGAGVGINSSGGNSGTGIISGGLMTSGSTAVGIGGGKGGNTYLINGASGIGGINTINGGENGFSTLKPLIKESTESTIRAGGGGDGVNGGGGGGGGYGGGGGGNLYGGGGGGSFTVGITLPLKPLITVNDNDSTVLDGRVIISTNQFIVPIEYFIGFPIGIASRNNKSDSVFGRTSIIRDDIYTITRPNVNVYSDSHPAFVTINDNVYFISFGRLYRFASIPASIPVSIPALTPMTLPQPDDGYFLIGNPYVTESGIVLVTSNSGKLIMYRYNNNNNNNNLPEFIKLGATVDSSFSDTTKNIPFKTNNIICATTTNVYSLSNSNILRNKIIDVSPIGSLTLDDGETIVFFSTSNDGIIIKYFITNKGEVPTTPVPFPAGVSKFKIVGNNINTSVNLLDSSYNIYNSSELLITTNYITFYTLYNRTIKIYYLLKNITELTSESIRTFSFETLNSSTDTIKSGMTSSSDYVYLTISSGLYIIKLPEINVSGQTALDKWFIPVYIPNPPPYPTPAYSFLPAPLIDASNNIFYGIGSTLYSMNVASMEFNWSIDLLQIIITNISIIR